MADFDVEVSWGDLLALEQIIGMAAREDMLVAEVGSWKGLSASVLARVVKANHGHIYAIDHWEGVLGSSQDSRAKSEDVYCIFRENMRRLGGWDIVHPMVMKSAEALRIFNDETLDFVFIDADHRYKAVKRDIVGWWQKLKTGGMICGHDCEGHYSQYSEETRGLLDRSLNIECIHDESGNYYHPGVIKALHDIFMGEFEINGGIWYRRKS